MAEILRSQTTTEILKKVGSKLDIEITATSTPNRNQVISWLNDAALILSRMMPEGRLGLLRDSTSQDDVGASMTLTEQYARVVSVKKFGVECTRMDQRDMDLISTRTPLLHTTRNPSYCISGDGGQVQLQFWPEGPGPVLVKAIRKPTAYADDDLWTPGTYTLPVELELLAVDYAVLQGKIQDEEMQQVQLLMQAWFQQAGIEGSIEGLGVAG